MNVRSGWVALAWLIASCAMDNGATVVDKTVDPNWPREDPVTYPEAPIVTVPLGDASVGTTGPELDADPEVPDGE